MEVRILGTIIREVDDDILPSSTWTFPLKFNPFQNVTAPSEGKKKKGKWNTKEHVKQREELEYLMKVFSLTSKRGKIVPTLL